MRHAGLAALALIALLCVSANGLPVQDDSLEGKLIKKNPSSELALRKLEELSSKVHGDVAPQQQETEGEVDQEEEEETVGQPAAPAGPAPAAPAPAAPVDPVPQEQQDEQAEEAEAEAETEAQQSEEGEDAHDKNAEAAADPSNTAQEAAASNADNEAAESQAAAKEGSEGVAKEAADVVPDSLESAAAAGANAAAQAAATQKSSNLASPAESKKAEVSAAAVAAGAQTGAQGDEQGDAAAAAAVGPDHESHEQAADGLEDGNLESPQEQPDSESLPSEVAAEPTKDLESAPAGPKELAVVKSLDAAGELPKRDKETVETDEARKARISAVLKKLAAARSREDANGPASNDPANNVPTVTAKQAPITVAAAAAAPDAAANAAVNAATATDVKVPAPGKETPSAGQELKNKQIPDGFEPAEELLVNKSETASKTGQTNSPNPKAASADAGANGAQPDGVKDEDGQPNDHDDGPEAADTKPSTKASSTDTPAGTPDLAAVDFVAAEQSDKEGPGDADAAGVNADRENEQEALDFERSQAAGEQQDIPPAPHQLSNTDALSKVEHGPEEEHESNQRMLEQGQDELDTADKQDTAAEESHAEDGQAIGDVQAAREARTGAQDSMLLKNFAAKDPASVNHEPEAVYGAADRAVDGAAGTQSEDHQAEIEAEREGLGAPHAGDEAHSDQQAAVLAQHMEAAQQPANGPAEVAVGEFAKNKNDEVEPDTEVPEDAAAVNAGGDTETAVPDHEARLNAVQVLRERMRLTANGSPAQTSTDELPLLAVASGTAENGQSETSTGLELWHMVVALALVGLAVGVVLRRRFRFKGESRYSRRSARSA